MTLRREPGEIRTPNAGSNGNSRADRSRSRRWIRPEVDDGAPYYVQRGDGTRVEIIAAARAAGWENLPDTSAQEPDEVELAVQREYERQHRDILENSRGELRSQIDAFDRQEREMPTPRELEVAVESAASDIERDLSNGQPLEALRREVTLRQRDLRLFRREHSLSRDAIYPTSRIRHWALLAPILVVESVANAGFFALGSDLGWLGGWLVAVTVSLINIVVGCLSGYFCFRWRHHPIRRIRRIATGGVVLYVVIAVVFNLAVARFRDAALAASAPQAMSPRQLLSLNEPLSLTSIALVLVGLIASGLSCWKGYRADDPAPGHGDRHRRLREADEELGKDRDRQHRLVIGHAESVPERCRSILRHAADTMNQLGEIVVGAERCAEGYDAQLRRVQVWCHQWLKKYRDENMRVRSTSPPKHFARYPGFEHELDTSAVQRLAERLAFNARRFEELKAEAQRIEIGQPERVHTAHERFGEYWAETMRRADSRRDGTSDVERGGNGRIASHA